jgi:hypothetical protein
MASPRSRGPPAPWQSCPEGLAVLVRVVQARLEAPLLSVRVEGRAAPHLLAGQRLLRHAEGGPRHLARADRAVPPRQLLVPQRAPPHARVERERRQQRASRPAGRAVCQTAPQREVQGADKHHVEVVALVHGRSRCARASHQLNHSYIKTWFPAFTQRRARVHSAPILFLPPHRGRTQAWRFSDRPRARWTEASGTQDAGTRIPRSDGDTPPPTSQATARPSTLQRSGRAAQSENKARDAQDNLPGGGDLNPEPWATS